MNLSVSEKRRLLREAWDYLLEQTWVTPEEYADYLARDAREHGEDLTPAASAEGLEAFSDSVAEAVKAVQEPLPLAGGAERGEGLGARGERGVLTQGGQPTPSAVGGREEVVGPVDAVGLEVGCGASAAASARGSGVVGELASGGLKAELSPRTPDPGEEASSRGAGCSGTEQTTLRRRDRPPRNRREQLFAERRERGRERRKQEEEARRAKGKF